MKKLSIVLRDPRKLKAAAYNPRKMPAAEMAKLRRSIRAFGMVEPIVCQVPGWKIIGGHQRVEAAIAEKLAQVPVIPLRISDARAKALNLALNRISGEWDQAKLRVVLEELLDPAGDGEVELTGFDSDEISELLAAELSRQQIEQMALRPAPELVWYLVGIPIEKFGEVQAHVAALESAAEISVQSSRDKDSDSKDKR